MTQHVQKLTHGKGYTHDVLIARDDSSNIQGVFVIDPVLCDLNCNAAGDEVSEDETGERVEK